MTWETIPLRGGSVSVSWRLPGGKGAGRQLCITVSSGVREAMGMARGDRVIVRRDRERGRLLLLPARAAGKGLCWPDGARAPRWRCTRNSLVMQVWAPLLDVTLERDMPAQSVAMALTDGGLELRLPHWACPLVKVTVGRAA